MKFLEKISPRKYQEEIFNTCKEKNCLVILSTGTGKTLIALMLAIERKRKFPRSKILFLAPTRPLAEQHHNYFEKHLPELFAEMILFTGKIPAAQRKKLWQTTEIIFSTPQCISNDLKKGLYTLSEVSLLIEDECHRCLKNYSYTMVAEKYKQQGLNQRFLGLTASPGSEKEKINMICKNLSIEAIEIRTRDSEDVKEYLKERKFQIVKLDFPKELEDLKIPLKKIYDSKVDELQRRKLLFNPITKRTLLEAQERIFRQISTGNKNFNVLSGASACAMAIKIQHAIELLETQTLYSFHCYLQDLQEQARQEKSKAVKQLINKPEFSYTMAKLHELLKKDIENPKLQELVKIMKKEIKSKEKIIVFAQFRDTITKICKTLNKENIPSRVFIGQAKKTRREKTELGLSQKEQKQVIRDFSDNQFNVLCATSIGEEGLDIPEVNAVIFYEPIPSEIRKIQRAGRTARLVKGKLIILLNKKTRDEAYYWSAFNKEKRMHKIIDKMKNGFSLKEEKQTKL